MAKTYVMGIDVGTNTTKGVIVDEECSLIHLVQTPHEMENPAPNTFEMDAEKVWWGDVCEVSRRLIAESGIAPEAIKVLGVSALGCDCVPVDKEGTALDKAILYGIDSRAWEEIDQLNEYYGEDAEKVFRHPICSSDIAPKVLWFKNKRPEVYKKAYKFLTGSSYLVGKLTGRYVIDKYLAEDFLPMYDLEREVADPEGCKLFCRPDQMADISFATDIAGTVTDKAAKETGLAVGTKVLVGTGDSGSEAVGGGVFRPGDMMVQLGSTCYFVYLADHMVEENRMWPGTFIIPETYAVCAGTNTAGTLTAWFRDRFYQDMVEVERQGGKNAYQAMSEDIADIPAGSDGLMFLPYLAGERTPINDPFASGMILGLSLNHTRSHLYKAALEGIACSIARHVNILEEDGLPVNKIMAVGGGTKNEPWLQIIADVVNKPIHIADISIGAAYGDALMALLHTENYHSWDDLADMVKPAKTYYPRKEEAAFYQNRLELFEKLYEDNKDSMHALKHQTKEV